jgi:hypothetical protein
VEISCLVGGSCRYAHGHPGNRVDVPWQRGAFVRSQMLIYKFGMAICDHPRIGMEAWRAHARTVWGLNNQQMLAIEQLGGGYPRWRLMTQQQQQQEVDNLGHGGGGDAVGVGVGRGRGRGRGRGIGGGGARGRGGAGTGSSGDAGAGSSGDAGAGSSGDAGAGSSGDAGAGSSGGDAGAGSSGGDAGAGSSGGDAGEASGSGHAPIFTEALEQQIGAAAADEPSTTGADEAGRSGSNDDYKADDYAAKAHAHLQKLVDADARELGYALKKYERMLENTEQLVALEMRGSEAMAGCYRICVRRISQLLEQHKVSETLQPPTVSHAYMAAAITPDHVLNVLNAQPSSTQETSLVTILDALDVPHSDEALTLVQQAVATLRSQGHSHHFFTRDDGAEQVVLVD